TLLPPGEPAAQAAPRGPGADRDPLPLDAIGPRDSPPPARERRATPPRALKQNPQSHIVRAARVQHSLHIAGLDVLAVMARRGQQERLGGAESEREELFRALLLDHRWCARGGHGCPPDPTALRVP